MTVGEALSRGAALLRAAPEAPPGAGTASPGLDAALLLGHILKTDRAGLVLKNAETLSACAEERFAQALEKRRSGLCVAYIVGRKEFRGLDFTVGPEVLVPRPDTETLVEAALACIDRRPSPALRLLDLCTGSGVLAISLKHERPGLEVYASDISAAALGIARLNAAGLLPGTAESPGEPPVSFFESDLFNSLGELRPRGFDLIIANPPYVPGALIDTLAPEVRREPRLALDGGADGLDIIRRLIPEARGFLRPGGVLLLEADPGQMAPVGGILASQGYIDIQTYRDLSDRPRVIQGAARGGGD
jgi:release factor glutamine methyltransferase